MINEEKHLSQTQCVDCKYKYKCYTIQEWKDDIVRYNYHECKNYVKSNNFFEL